jgi:peptidoglycan/LPS O-acetylase OafA/YrhL
VGALVSVVALGYLAWNRCLDHSQYYNGLFTAVALMVAACIVRLLSAPSRVGSLLLESTPLVGVGRISYGLYLYHIPIMYYIQPKSLGWSNPGASFLVLGLTLSAALVSFFCIERPCLRLKDRLGAPSTATGTKSIEADPRHFDGETPRQIAA